MSRLGHVFHLQVLSETERRARLRQAADTRGPMLPDDASTARCIDSAATWKPDGTAHAADGYASLADAARHHPADSVDAEMNKAPCARTFPPNDQEIHRQTSANPVMLRSARPVSASAEVPPGARHRSGTGR
jgi:hypothetical protein